jgi:serine O-acetyltransferase
MDFERVVDSLSDLSDSEMYHYSVDSMPFPLAEKLVEIVDLCRSLLFPGYYGRGIVDARSLKFHVGVDAENLYCKLSKQIAAGLSYSCASQYKSKDELWSTAGQLAQDFVNSLPDLRRTLAQDVLAHYRNDPAAHNQGEVIMCYPGLKAISSYRIAHKLVELGVPLIPRIITEMAHSETGIDINPEATIGCGFAIDHGTGVVIGATCIIGRNVTLYQGVTLGAKNFPQNEDGSLVKGIERHPILGDNVIVYANATILGRVTIGSGSVIGGNLWVVHDVPENTKLFYSEYKSVDR